MNQLFYMVFSNDASLTNLMNPPTKIQSMQENDLKEAFFTSLSRGDIARFTDFCKSTPDYTRIQGCMGVFRMYNFYGFSYAFAQKSAVCDEGEIYVTFFKNARKLSEFLSPAYLRFFPAMTDMGENELLFSPASELLRRNAPSLSGMKTNHTNIVELTEKLMDKIIADPVFYGNRFSFCAEAPDSKMSEVCDYLLRFSTSAYIHLLYALFTALIEATVSHQIAVRIEKYGCGAKIEITTRTNPNLTSALDHVTDLTVLSSYAVYSETLMAFAEIISEAYSIHPYVSYLPDEGLLSVSLHVAEDTASEGEFRYRVPYEEIATVLAEASALYRLLSLQNTPLFDKKEQ